jgi:hypothetical protein
MMKTLVSIALLAVTLDSIALANLNDEAAARNELYIRKLGKSGKGGKAEVHPDLHHHGYHPHHMGKSGKAETGGKSAKGAIAIDHDHGWAAVGDDDGDDDHSVGDDGYEWSDDGNTTSMDVSEGDDAAMHPIEEEVSMDVSDGDDAAMHPIEEEVHHHHHEDDDGDDDDDWWADDMHYGKSGKGAKGSKGAKSAKGGKSGKVRQLIILTSHLQLGWNLLPRPLVERLERNVPNPHLSPLLRRLYHQFASPFHARSMAFLCRQQM